LKQIGKVIFNKFREVRVAEVTEEGSYREINIESWHRVGMKPLIFSTKPIVLAPRNL